MELGRWVIPYLNLLKNQKGGKEKRESFFRQYWDNSSVRRYYIDQCMRKRKYEEALKALDDSIRLDQNYRGPWSAITPGNLELFKEVKKLYSEEEWISNGKNYSKNFLLTHT